MNVQPFLPAFTATSNTRAFTEATNKGHSRYIEVIKEPFVPLYTLDNSVASPFDSSLICTSGSKNVDGACIGRQQPGASHPFWQPNMPLTFQMQPFELLMKSS